MPWVGHCSPLAEVVKHGHRCPKYDFTSDSRIPPLAGMVDSGPEGEPRYTVMRSATNKWVLKSVFSMFGLTDCKNGLKKNTT